MCIVYRVRRNWRQYGGTLLAPEDFKGDLRLSLGEDDSIFGSAADAAWRVGVQIDAFRVRARPADKKVLVE